MCLRFGITINPHRVYVATENIVIFYANDIRFYDCKKNSCLLKDKKRNGEPIVTIDNKTVIIKKDMIIKKRQRN